MICPKLIIGPSGIEISGKKWVLCNTVWLIIGPSGIEISYANGHWSRTLNLIIGPSGIEIWDVGRYTGFPISL